VHIFKVFNAGFVLGMVWMPVITASQEIEVGRSWFEANSGKSMRPYLGKKMKQKSKRATDVAPVVEQGSEFNSHCLQNTKPTNKQTKAELGLYPQRANPLSVWGI
jgi:hypothetical protein